MTSSSSQKWPASRAFVFMLRQLERSRRYVPPYQQPAPTGLLLARTTPPTTATDEPAVGEPVWRRGPWVFDVNDHGDLVARHDSGYEHTVATAPDSERQDDNNG